MYRGGSSLIALLSLPFQPFLLDGWVSVWPSARWLSSINSDRVFLGLPGPRPLVGLSFGTFFSQPSLCSTWLCHLSRRVRRSFARSSSCILSKRSCELTWSLVMMPHIHWIIAWSLHCKQCKSSWSWGPGFACKEHNIPDTWIVELICKLPAQ